MNYHSLLTVSMPLLVLGICMTNSLHYYLIHLSARLTSLKFSRCSFIAPQQVYIGASISLSQTARSSPHVGFDAAGCVLLQRATLPSPLPLCPHYWRPHQPFLVPGQAGLARHGKKLNSGALSTHVPKRGTSMTSRFSGIVRGAQ